MVRSGYEVSETDQFEPGSGSDHFRPGPDQFQPGSVAINAVLQDSLLFLAREPEGIVKVQSCGSGSDPKKTVKTAKETRIRIRPDIFLS